MLWCRSGRGEIALEDWQGPLLPGMAVLAPWAHTISYRAERRDPFLVSALHVIPGLNDQLPLARVQVVHRVVDPERLAADGHAEGEHPLGRRSSLIALGRHPALHHLAEFALLVYRRGTWQDSELRSLARQLLLEWTLALGTPHEVDPAPLARAREYVQQHLGRRINREELSRAAGVSPATLQRLTASALHMSPAAWCLQQRIDAAGELLARSRLPLATIATRFGFCDAFHFSRMFRRRKGVAPTLWRRQHPLL